MKFYQSWFVLLLFGFFRLSVGCCSCVGNDIVKYGNTTYDYGLAVGSNLIINCTLENTTFPGIAVPVDSSYLSFKKNGDSDRQNLAENTHQVSNLTAQLWIETATDKDSGNYYCRLNLPNGTYMHVCSTKVDVGYPPSNVTNFTCTSRNFDNLTCTWNVKPNKVRTNYSLQRVFLQNELHDCPYIINNTSCQWRRDTNPIYDTLMRNLTFIVHGNNSLGGIENEFTFEHFAIVIPNHPEELKTVMMNKQGFTIQWKPPIMNNIVERPALYYQLWLEDLGPEPSDKKIFEVGVDKLNYTFKKLIPHYNYRVSIRCKSNLATGENMWSLMETLAVQTEPDIPYLLPEIHSEAFLMHNYGDYRNTTLYWKPVPERHHNGDNFYYHIEHSVVDSSESTNKSFATSKYPFVKIGSLENDAVYILKIHSANKQGISKKYKTMLIDEENKILETPKYIRVVSDERGYHLSWSGAGFSDEDNYTVFWCKSLKPTQCDGPINWSDTIVKKKNISLDITDTNAVFQFAVAASNKNKSSGLQWASCIVSHNALLGKIPIDVNYHPITTDLRVSWTLECEGQKSLVDRYVITYCREKKDCRDVAVTPDTQDFWLRDLKPNSNYCVKLKAFNKDNKPSEEVEEVCKKTLFASPSDPPRNIEIVSRSSTSFKIQWLPPLEPNGIITYYYIHYNNYKQFVKNDASCQLCESEIRGLENFALYNVSVEACVNDMFCSPLSSPVKGQTDVGIPGKMERPQIDRVNETHFKVSWLYPKDANGPIDFFNLQWRHDGENETIGNAEFINDGSLSTFIEFGCPLLEGRTSYLFYVRAGNLMNGITLYGPFSDPVKAADCLMSQGLAMIIGVAIGGTLALAFFLLIVYRLVKWMSEKIHQVKNIAVRLPKDLEGPDSNPLNNFDSFKNGLVKTIQVDKSNHLPYAIDENDNKNRHGSGSSQFSNSSTDELIFKNDKCTKFGRKPSGSSSGCSSISSNTTKRVHLSSDSGTESDFVSTPSPNSVDVEEPNFNSSHKQQMPVLLEVHESKILTKTDKNTLNVINGMILKINQPYSKFGMTGNVSSLNPSHTSPLAVYSYNLANSEPSMFESQTSSMMLSYSKVGLAKSSGDILGMTMKNKDIAYSKFGLSDNIDSGVKTLVQFFGVAIPSELENKEQLCDINVLSRNVPQSLHHTVENEKTCNSMYRKADVLSKTPSSGYVQVGDVRTKDIDNIYSSLSSLEEDDCSLQIPCDFSDLSTVWTTGVPPSNAKLDNFCLDKPDSPIRTINSYHQNGGQIICVAPSQSSGCLQIVAENGDSDDHFNFLNTHRTSPVISNQMLEHVLENNTPPSVVSPILPSGKNGYVPFSTVGDCVVPNTTESNSDSCTDADQNYITPSNKGELKLLQEGNHRSSKTFSTLLHCNGSKMRRLSDPLKYILKPLPKMESEICEV